MDSRYLGRRADECKVIINLRYLVYIERYSIVEEKREDRVTAER